MTYQGERARPMAGENGRYFEVSKVRIGPDGHVSDVLWAEVDTGTDRNVGPRVLATAAEVVDAIHDGAEVAGVFPSSERVPDRPFVVVKHTDGRECIAFDGAPLSGRNVTDLQKLDDRSGKTPNAIDSQARTDAGMAAPARPASEHRAPHHEGAQRLTFAVSKVRLDTGGRITDVLWGRVDPAKNDWATSEVIVAVAAVVDALHAGSQVFALFPATHGHLRERRFVVADYDGDRKTIVLDGGTARDREVHDMDRLDGAASP
ncbi:hypothetical protein [Hydrogenophaga sp. PAMC20947]|uniref:hypothetical protein n=1 Tax=Hydrogenophaga sp. PAMC20947 TaxID=2565558 RepID=UPI00109E075C|nr:hypothetical protein [Hydrogenophaga sp. PAMC20947]QCB45560.1 hypothetical protein E5678_05700 [Hydrogenophaga sp. PAMC20947]